MGAENQESAPLDFTLAGESRRAFTSESLPQRLELYALKHKRAIDMAEYIRNHANFNSFIKNRAHSGMVFKLRSCGSHLLFRDYFTVDQIRLHKANFCKKFLLCPLCAVRRASKFVASYMERLQIVQSTTPGITPYLVTITVKDGPDLQERFLHLKHGIEKMTEQRKEAERDRRPPLEMNKALGGVSSYEVKKGENSQEWHPHYHGTWLCKERPYETALSQEWKEITGDSYIVDVKPFHNDQDAVIGFLEVFSYAMKFSTLTLEDNLEAYLTLHRKRFINSFGIFRGVQVPELLEDEPLENLPFVELLFQYVKGSGYSFIPPKK